MLERGYIQVYTGNGKGKTTAALGITLRTTCAGNKAFIGQFMKGQDYSEKKAVAFLPGLSMEQFGGTCFVNGTPHRKGYLRCKERTGKNEGSAFLRGL